MYPETKPILFKCPAKFDTVVIYPIHDLHYGNECFNLQKWNYLKKEILEAPNTYVIWIGDLMENAVPGSKSDVFSQMYSPLDQREFVTEQFKDLADRTIAIVDGNHEHNRSTKMAGLYPLYDCACIAKIEERYRSAYAVIDISVGTGKDGHKNPQHYIGYATHRAKELKSFAACDQLDGFDFFLYGHDHDPHEHPRAKLCYNSQQKVVSFKSCEMINSGSFLNYGGYAPRGAYRPLSDKVYKMVLHGGRHPSIETIGFYVKEQ